MLFCVLGIILPILAFIVLFPIVVGIIYFNSPCDKPLSLFLLIYGLIPRRWWPCFHRSYALFFEFISLIWFIVGCIWTFQSSPQTCDATLYYCSFYFVIISLGLVALSCCCLCFVGFIVYFWLVPILSAVQPSGLTDDQLKALKPKPYKIGTYDEQDSKCSICLSNYDEEEMITEFSCHHHFHDSCVRVWLGTNNSCPLCREPIVPAQNSIV
eukprot:c33936_g1_i1.p1 GENE.c33936_g1_i1~~c33936_g1_i1.p1  ORF type:complete len:212 (-),score=54.34 c33936_g1_i1:61-696(-)